MTDHVICAEGLGKKYMIGHEAARREPYTALRDVVARQVRGIGRSAIDIVRGRPTISGDEIEEFWALKDIDFAVSRGEVVGIIGRNGAGKSTLLKILSRITEPSVGRVTITGRLASLLEVGTGFHPELSGRENIFLNGAILGMSRSEVAAKFDEIVAFAEIERFLDTPVKRYSSGMYVRLAFAVAAHLEPDILIVDEVLAVGDAQFQAKCLGKMRDVVDSGERTVLFVSHNMGAIRALCSTGILLDRGAIVAAGAVAIVTEAYLSQPAGRHDELRSRSAVSFVSNCRVQDSKGMDRTTCFSNEDLVVAISFVNRENVRGLRVGIRVCRDDGVVLACFTPEDEGLSTPHSKGQHNLRVTIPKNTFLKGEHYIGGALWNGGTKEIFDDSENLAQFTVEAAAEGAYRCEYVRPGVFQSKATWKI